MRITVSFYSATTSQVRDLSVALAQVLGDNHLTLGVEGPEHWGGSTPALTPNQFAEVFARLSKFQGAPIAEALKGAS